MGIEALYPKPKTTLANKEHKKYPYLLKDGSLPIIPNISLMKDILGDKQIKKKKT